MFNIIQTSLEFRFEKSKFFVRIDLFILRSQEARPPDAICNDVKTLIPSLILILKNPAERSLFRLYNCT